MIVQGLHQSDESVMLDLRLYALVDPERANGRALDDLARRVVAGGATLVQLRDKHGATRRLVEEARAIKQALGASGVPLLVNDRVDVALAAGADGVHVGQDDMTVADARRLLGVRAIAGIVRSRTAKKLPIAAIAGIDQRNAGDVIAAGADGVAVISALSMTADPAAAARELRAAVDRALTARAGS